ncbi:hypothetical protein [Streptomyces chartreusis]|uniref:hypothetical protein n=1 Tax=Streptomyces chartreusis TaxID=1969 RepID=UPI00381CC481
MTVRRYIDDLSDQDIATVLKCSLGTVRRLPCEYFSKKFALPGSKHGQDLAR